LSASGEELDKPSKLAKQFVGFELPNGRSGSWASAQSAWRSRTPRSSGMQVLGYDPAITVQHAWELSSGVQKAVNLDDLFARSDVVTVHCRSPKTPTRS
jgi:D-3-phosphoglycerate dehydrogenase